jgi:colanic acid/amylovoran biosynthesis glycosyltransferase
MITPGRIVLFSRDFPALSQTFLANRFRLLVERGWDVHVICEQSAAADREAFPGISRLYDRVHMLHSSGDLPAVLARWRPGVLHFEFGHHARDYIDLVPGHPWSLVVGFQGYDICIKGLDQEPGYYAPVWDRADAVNFPSEDIRARARDRGLPAEMPTAVTPPLADLDLFDPGERRHVDVAGSPQRPLRVLSVGRLHWKKGVDYGLRAVKRLIDQGLNCDVRVVGDGPSRTELVHASGALGIQDDVHFMGSLPPQVVRDEFLWADILIVPSVSEGFCMAALEAQAMSVPVVASDAEGLSENVAHGQTGFIVPRRVPDAMAVRLAELAASPEMRQRMGDAGRQRALSHFSKDRQIKRYEALYGLLLDGPRD